MFNSVSVLALKRKSVFSLLQNLVVSLNANTLIEMHQVPGGCGAVNAMLSLVRPMLVTIPKVASFI